MSKKNKIKKFVSDWIKGHEPGTFVKNEHGNIVYSAGHSSLNLTAFFENILSDYSEEVKTAVADYMGSEGCGCCGNYEAHKEHHNKLGKLLNVKQYADKSGYDFSQCRSTDS